MPRFERPEPRSIKFVLHMRVAVFRSAHECSTANDLAARVFGNDLFTAKSVLCRKHAAGIELGADLRHRLFHLRRLGCDNSQIALRNFVRVRGRLERGMKIVLARDLQPMLI